MFFGCRAGRGSYGSVYKARVYETGEIVAVKVIPLTEQDEISSIQREVAVLRECNHPNVVKYYVSARPCSLCHPLVIRHLFVIRQLLPPQCRQIQREFLLAQLLMCS
jgi:serine/threonine protein kinase